MDKQMKRALVMNDLKRNKAVNLALFSFIFISALLMASGALVIERLTGALDEIFEIAQPPHYLQMHVGPIDEAALSKFAADTGLVKTYEIQDMVNVEGTNIGITRQDLSTDSFSDSVMDNYFVTQNQNFDFLLDLNNQKVQMQPGEVGVPVSYAREKHIQVGDTLVLNLDNQPLELRTAALIRDAQMGSSLASSIRFAVNPQDFKQIKDHSLRYESIIAFRLNNESDINSFASLYQQEEVDLPKNGVAITLPLIKLLNGIGDGLMSGVIMLVSLILIGIAILNIRFAVLSTLEDDVKAIGTLSAIGLNTKEINSIYKLKYIVLALAGCVLGALASFGVAEYFMSNIALNFGVSQATTLTYLTPFIAVSVLFLIIMGALHRILRVVSQMTIIQALTEGKLVSQRSRKQAKSSAKLKTNLFQIDMALGFQLFRHNFKAWRLFILVFFLTTVTILMPLNLYMTMGSPEFTNYVGAAKSDVRLSVEYNPKLENTIQAIERQLAQEPKLEKWHKFKSLKGSMETEVDGNPLGTAFVMESGDYSQFPVKLESGHLPVKRGEIALSALNLQRLGLQINDTLTVTLNDKQEVFKVVGVYQDITNGGITAKIAAGYDGDIAQYAFFVNVLPEEDQTQLVDTWRTQFPEAKVMPVEKLLDQTLGTITNSMKIAVIAVFVISMVTVGLLTALFITLQMHKNSSDDAMLLAIGFKETDLRRLYLFQSAIAMTLGITLGALTAVFVGESMMGVVLSALSFGLTHIQFLIHPAYFLLLGCIAPLLVGLGLTWQITGRLTQDNSPQFETN